MGKLIFVPVGKYILILFSLFFQTILCFGQGTFPTSIDSLGYVFSAEQAKVAYPINNKARIWVKGSKERKTVIVAFAKSKKKVKELKLQPPFFTTVIEVPSDSLRILFCDSTGRNCFDYGNLYPVKQFDDKEAFSVLFYGCMEPFAIEKGKAVVNNNKNQANFRVRKLFESTAMNRPAGYSILISDSTGKKDSLFKTENLIAQPLMVIGTGDQMYVDAAYGGKAKKGEPSLMSAWESKRRPEPTIPLADYPTFLNNAYSATFSFNTMQNVFRYLPTINVIDDHELRDGWGSQGDENKTGKKFDLIRGFYQEGRSAYINHQLIASNYEKVAAEKLIENNQSMHYSFVVNGVNGFVFDLRTDRNSKQKQIIDAEQWTAFEDWLKNLSKNQEVIIATSIPVSVRPSNTLTNILSFLPIELKDDVRDSWSSRANKAERAKLFEMVTKYRVSKSILPIFVSGDVHKSSLVEMWADTTTANDQKDAFVLGYEIIASGLSHEFGVLKKEISEATEAQRLGNKQITFCYNNKKTDVEPMVRISKAEQNFGAIEFTKGEPTKLHSFQFNKGRDEVVQYYIPLNWNKTIAEEKAAPNELRKGNKVKKKGWRSVVVPYNIVRRKLDF